MIEIDKVWLDGKIVDEAQARFGILTHSLHYGLAVFEGIRCYETERGPAVFRLREHVERFFDSARIVQMDIPYTPDELTQGILDTIKANKLGECYIRPIAFFGQGKMGILNKGLPTRVAVAVWKWGAYLGEEGLRKGIRCKVSSYARHHVNVSMTKAKLSGNYVNSQLAKREAVDDGYDEAVMLDPWGYVAEGTGENIFIVRYNHVLTPSRTAILEGITRHTVIRLCQHMGLPLREESITRDELLMADEVFLTGTAAEITPVREIDRRRIGSGEPGEITRKLQTLFHAASRGEMDEFRSWLTYVE